MVITLEANFTVFAFLGVGEDGCFRSLLCCYMVGSVIQPSFVCCDEASPMLIFADFCFRFDNWLRLVGIRKNTSVRARDTQKHNN
ncbi:UNVERIFIED_CONTAM: hypothetical protein NCL1_12526 [Trichonephila clavipes]